MLKKTSYTEKEFQLEPASREGKRTTEISMNHVVKNQNFI